MNTARERVRALPLMVFVFMNLVAISCQIIATVVLLFPTFKDYRNLISVIEFAVLALALRLAGEFAKKSSAPEAKPLFREGNEKALVILLKEKIRQNTELKKQIRNLKARVSKKSANGGSARKMRAVKVPACTAPPAYSSPRPLLSALDSGALSDTDPRDTVMAPRALLKSFPNSPAMSNCSDSIQEMTENEIERLAEGDLVDLFQ